MKLNKLIKNQKGQGIMEYVIISSLIGIVCLTMVSKFGQVINERVEEMKERVANEINVTSNSRR